MHVMENEREGGDTQQKNVSKSNEILYVSIIVCMKHVMYMY